MRKIILYSACSLDGYIAKTDGDISWLDAMSDRQHEDYDYHQFYDSIDTTLMGNKTYTQIKTFNTPFPYAGKKNYVFTKSKDNIPNENVTYINDDIPAFISELKKQEGKDIWLVGGGEVNSLLLEHKLIDDLWIFTMPIILGDGIHLFKNTRNVPLRLASSKSYSTGVVLHCYEFKS